MIRWALIKPTAKFSKPFQSITTYSNTFQTIPAHYNLFLKPILAHPYYIPIHLQSTKKSLQPIITHSNSFRSILTHSNPSQPIQTHADSVQPIHIHSNLF